VKVTCPSCGADMDLDVLLAHEDSRHAMARLAVLSLPLGKLVLQYLRLFKPATRQMSHTRVVALVEELLPDLQRNAITRNGRDWAAPLDVWRTAIEKILETRDGGKLTLPLKTHGYLYEIILGLADKQEATAERDTEAQRRNQARGGTAVQPVQPVQAMASVAAAPAPVPAYYTQPSRAALKIREQIEAKRKPRAPGEDA
jgi:hypothetical protein